MSSSWIESVSLYLTPRSFKYLAAFAYDISGSDLSFIILEEVTDDDTTIAEFAFDVRFRFGS